jgi:hypothetical protein
MCIKTVLTVIQMLVILRTPIIYPLSDSTVTRTTTCNVPGQAKSLTLNTCMYLKIRVLENIPQ